MVPEGWHTASLASLCSKPISYGIVQTGDKDVGTVPCVRVVDLTRSVIDRSEMITTTVDISRAYRKTVLEPDEIMMALRGEIGLVKLVPQELAGCNLTRGIARIAAKKSIVLPDYLLRQIQSAHFRTELLRRVNGSALQEIPLGELRAVSVLVAPLPEQQKIAEILSAWDKAIETTEALLANARTQKRALMQSLLTGTRRFPGFEDHPWREVRFDSVFDRIKRKNSVGNTNVLTISGQDGLVSQNTYFNKRVASADLSKYTLLAGGDFAYNKSYSNGYPMGAIKVLPHGVTGVVSSLYLCFRLRAGSPHSLPFFRHYFEAGCFDEQISAIAQEGARNHGLLNVSVVEFFETNVRTPSPDEQRQIAAAIDVAEDEETAIRNSLESLRTEKKSLMQQLLTGKLRVIA